jgi:glycosyltransferase involved in cell wall biosynthesis
MPTVHPEAKGLPAIEAMAAGVPVVAPDHGTFPELLGGGDGTQAAGLLHRPGDPADLARVIGELLTDPVRAAALGGRGHALARGRHSADAMAAAHARLYAGL